jgi:hypothetical protein
VSRPRANVAIGFCIYGTSFCKKSGLGLFITPDTRFQKLRANYSSLNFENNSATWLEVKTA